MNGSRGSSVTELNEVDPISIPQLGQLAGQDQAERIQHHSDSVHSLFQSFYSPNYLNSKVEADCPIPHTFAVIIELGKEYAVKDLKFKFQSSVNLMWPSGDPYNKSYSKEKFKIGNMEWKTCFKESDYYINTSNSNDFRSRDITLNDLLNRTRSYKLVGPDSPPSNIDDLFPLSTESDLVGGSFGSNNGNNSSSSGEDTYFAKAGIYVFLLPIVLPEHIPPTITSINGGLGHSFSIQFMKISNKLNRRSKVNSSFELPMVRTPPSFANSIADKPIYVNRVWNDSLHYTITFPKKYVSLGQEHQINVKLVPLVKDVVIKRIKFNVLERITYVSKNLAKEIDFDSEDPFYLRPILPDGKIRERIVPICELKTKAKSNNSGVDPYKEELIKCPDNNLLFSCYEQELQRQNKNTSNENVMIASPLDINIALPFLTTKSDKAVVTNSGGSPNQNSHFYDDLDNIDPHTPIGDVHRRQSSTDFPSSPKIGSLETNMHHHVSDFNLDSTTGIGGNSHRNEGSEQYFTPDHSIIMGEDVTPGATGGKDNPHVGYTSVTKALYPDSNFRHIQIHHRLQVCFRISKPDPKDNFKVHHYEVVVDTPLILLSAKCAEDSIQLPQYNEFENDFSFENDAEAQTLTRNDSSTGGVTFRTPQFAHNGVSIQPLQGGIDDETRDILPSFEEATSPSSSPITRSISFGDTDPLSRIPSLNQIDPIPPYDAPAYAEYTIDEIVQPLEQHLSSSPQKSSSNQNLRIRSSLLNSFAPPVPLELAAISKDVAATKTPLPESVNQEPYHLEVPTAMSTTSNISDLDTPPNIDSENNEVASTNESESATSTSTNESVIFALSESQEVSTVESNNSALVLENIPKEEGNSKAVSALSDSAANRKKAITLKRDIGAFINNESSSRSETESINEYDPRSLIRPHPSRVNTGHSSLFTLDTTYTGDIPISATNTLNFSQGLPLLENYSNDELQRTSTQFSSNVDSLMDKTDNLSLVTAEQFNQENTMFS